MPRVTHTPTGRYPKPAHMHHIDLESAAAELREKLPGSRRQTESLARENGVSVVLMAMEAGDAVKEHAAEGVVTVQLLDGHAAVASEGETIDLQPGELLVFEPNIRHDIRAEEQSVVLLTITGAETVTQEA